MTNNITIISLAQNNMLGLTKLGFANMQNKDRVLNSRPWVYDNLPLVVLPWREGLELDGNAFNKTWIWVQI